MTMTLTITDNANGTGGMATIAGVGVPATITLYVGQFSGAAGLIAWANTYTRTNDGTITIPLANGHYWAYAQTDQIAGVSSLFGLQYFTLTNGNNAVHYQTLSAVQFRLQALAMSGIASGSIVVKKLPMQRLVKEGGLAMPAILITPVRESMNPTAGTNALDDEVLPVLLTILEADNQEATLALNLDRHSKWREQIRRAFHNQRLPGVTEIFNCAVEPADVIIPAAWNQNLYASALLLKFSARVPRGLNA